MEGISGIVKQNLKFRSKTVTWSFVKPRDDILTRLSLNRSHFMQYGRRCHPRRTLAKCCKIMMHQSIPAMPMPLPPPPPSLPGQMICGGSQKKRQMLHSRAHPENNNGQNLMNHRDFAGLFRTQVASSTQICPFFCSVPLINISCIRLICWV